MFPPLPWEQEQEQEQDACATSPVHFELNPSADGVVPRERFRCQTLFISTWKRSCSGFWLCSRGGWHASPLWDPREVAREA